MHFGCISEECFRKGLPRMQVLTHSFVIVVIELCLYVCVCEREREREGGREGGRGETGAVAVYLEWSKHSSIVRMIVLLLDPLNLYS